MESVSQDDIPSSNTGSDVRESSESTASLGASSGQKNWVVQVGRLEAKTKEICAKNVANRSKLTLPHTGGSKRLKRRATEIIAETGQQVSRGSLFVQTHKKKNGTYINSEAQVVCEKIIEIESQGTITKEVSPNDSLGQVLGKERPGRVRGLGLGWIS
ncbi:hypothetical protein RJT34_12178 [Clitoria ternatea]|uniref:Uncharacterized protein n=1 Tax=Clitoria ternatea TaxID=43366 RepID=A0AAN9JLE9_CLITE